MWVRAAVSVANRLAGRRRRPSQRLSTIATVLWYRRTNATIVYDPSITNNICVCYSISDKINTGALTPRNFSSFWYPVGGLAEGLFTVADDRIPADYYVTHALGRWAFKTERPALKLVRLTLMLRRRPSED